MKITKENIQEFPEIENKSLLKSLLSEIDAINYFINKKIFLDYQTYHNEYSPERTDPCPDYYGYYTLRYEHKPNFSLGGFMTLNDLEYALWLLIDFVEELKDEN